VAKSGRTQGGLAQVLAGLVIGLGLGVALWFFLNGNWRSTTANRPQAARVDQPAPDFALQNLAGETVSLAEQRGRVVVLNFWASWCDPCVQEMPTLEAYSSKYAQDVAVIGVNAQESAATVSSFVDKLAAQSSVGVLYEILLDVDGQVGRAYQTYALPTTYFIDREGVVRYRHIGFLSEAQLQEYLTQLGVGK
jgi:thiol-disulfide isomerase/thioredoxin